MRLYSLLLALSIPGISVIAQTNVALRADGLLTASNAISTSDREDRLVKLSAEVRIVEAKWGRAGNSVAPGKSLSRTSEWVVPFICEVGKKTWQMEGRFSANSRQLWVFDGTNVMNAVHITERPPPALDPSPQIPLSVLQSNVTIRVYSTAGGFPVGTVDTGVPWLALCSGAYLKRPGRVIPLPVADVPASPDTFGYSDKTEVFEDELGLPKSVELLTSQKTFEQSVLTFFHGRLQYPNQAKSKSPDGECKFRYTVTESTNYLGWNFPLAFEFIETIPQAFDFDFRVYRGTGKVTVVGDSHSFIKNVFDPNLHQIVVDRRFGKQKGLSAIVYAWSNNFLAPTSDPYLQSRVKATISRAHQAHLYKTIKPKLLAVLSILVLLMPLVFFVRSLRNRKK